jgi:MSHA pilin protein MshD
MCISRHRRQHGITLIELIMFIVIVSVALVGVLSVLNVTTRSSADPMIRKQMLAIAEAVLEEVQSQPFTYCDPDDRSVATATSAVLDATATNPLQCWDAVEVAGTETVSGNTDARLSATFPFDNVSDYNGLALASPIPGVSGNTFAPAGYTATIAVASDAVFGPAGARPPAAAVLRITVTVTHTATGNSIALEGYRTRFSPNFTP